MALLKCPECGKEVSDKATACPNCGCPIENVIENLGEKIIENTDSETAKENLLESEDEEQSENEGERKSIFKKELSLTQKKIIIAVGVIAVIVIGMIAYFTVDYRAYQNAVSSYNAQQYDSAIKAFEELGDYSDSEEYLNKSYYESGKTAYGEKDYDKAMKQFKEVIDYEDSQTLYNQSAYDKAQEMMDTAQYGDAAKLFAEIKDFKDAKIKSEKCEFEASVDGAFLRDFVKALEERWKKSDEYEKQGTATTDIKMAELYEEFVNTELTILEPYEHKQFISKELKETYKLYMNALELQKEAIDYILINASEYLIKWEEAYGERARIIYQLNEE